MEELDLKELLTMFWNKKIQIALVTAIFIVIGLIYTMEFVKPKYTSSTTLVLATSENSAQKSNTITATDITLNSKLVSTYSELVKSKNVLRTVISNLGINIKEDQLKNSIAVSPVSDTELIKISVTTEDASNSAKIANEIAKVFTTKVSEIYNINNVHVVDEAETNGIPSNINHSKDILIFALAGFIIAIIYVLVANMLDTTIKTVEDVEKQFKIPVIASIPMYIFDSEKGGKKK